MPPWLAWAGLLMAAVGALMSAVGVVRSGVGLSPILAYNAGSDVTGNVVRASHDARRRKWARVAVAGLVLAMLGILLANLAG